MILAALNPSAVSGGINIAYAISAILGIAALMGGFAWVFGKSATKARLSDLALQLEVMRSEMNDWRQRAQDSETEITKIKAAHASVQAKMTAALETLRAENVVLTEKVTNAAKVDKMVAILERMDSKLDKLGSAA